MHGTMSYKDVIIITDTSHRINSYCAVRGVSNTGERNKKCIRNFGRKTWTVEDHFGDGRVERVIIVKRILKY
jgi:hypothetical protein